MIWVAGTPSQNGGIKMILPITNQSGKGIAAFNMSCHQMQCMSHLRKHFPPVTMPSGPVADQDLAFFRIILNRASSRHPGRLRDTPYQGHEAVLRAWRVGDMKNHPHQKAWDPPPPSLINHL